MSSQFLDTTLVMQDDMEKRAADSHFTVVFNESQLPELVHKEGDPGASSTDHLGQGFMSDFGHNGLRALALAETGEEQQGPGQPLFTGVEKLVYQVFLDPHITREQVLQKKLRKGRFLMQDLGHRFPRDLKHCTIAYCYSSCHASVLPGETSLAQKIARG